MNVLDRNYTYFGSNYRTVGNKLVGKILEILCSIRKLFVVGKYIYWKYGRLEISVYSYGNNMQ